MSYFVGRTPALCPVERNVPTEPSVKERYKGARSVYPLHNIFHRNRGATQSSHGLNLSQLDDCASATHVAERRMQRCVG